MKKFSISNLESARKNPSDFGKTLNKGDNPNSVFNRPKSVRWLDAVKVYHNTLNLSNAINGLERSFSNRKDTPKNKREVETLIFALEHYVFEHNKLEYIHLESCHSIEIILSPKVKITGWIWLINMTNTGGRTGYVVTNKVIDSTWESELRFPIIQNYIANNIYGCEMDEVEVGVIDFTTGQHHHTTFSSEEIEDALSELDSIGHDITNVLD